jgi:preprotein translocase subunit SecE
MGVRIPPPVQNYKVMNKISNYISESFQEFKDNVTWPTWEEVQRYTIIVAIFSVVFALATWGVDTLFGKAIAGIFNLIKS